MQYFLQIPYVNSVVLFNVMLLIEACQFISPKGQWSEGSIVRRVDSPDQNMIPSKTNGYMTSERKHMIAVHRVFCIQLDVGTVHFVLHGN